MEAEVSQGRLSFFNCDYLAKRGTMSFIRGFSNYYVRALNTTMFFEFKLH